MVPVIWLGRRSSPLGPVVPVKGSVCWPPVRSPGQGRAPRSVAWGARRPPTTRLALTWVISLGGGIYRVGARRGATPPSTPVHEVDCGQGSSGPETYIHIYIYIRPVAAPLPATTQGSRSPATPSPAGTQTQPARSLAPSWSKALARWTGPRRHPFSLIPFPPRRLPSVHLSLPTGECSGPTRDRRPEPLPPTPGGGGNALVPGPWSPLPAPHRNPRPRRDRSPWLTALPASVPCHAGWTDGSVAQVHAASPAVRLPSHCHFAAPPRPRRSALLKRRPVK